MTSGNFGNFQGCSLYDISRSAFVTEHRYRFESGDRSERQFTILESQFR
jgi:hypothetical protein